MSWILRYRCRKFLRTSICAIPMASVAAALLIAPVLRWIDNRTKFTLLGFGLEGSRAVAGALDSSILTFVVFSFSTILLAVQIASGQLTPRVIGRLLEGRAVKLTLSVLMFSYTYTLLALGRIEDRVPQLPVLVAALSSLVSVFLFLYMIQRTGVSLRPGVILAGVASATADTIRAVYPGPFLALKREDLAADFKSAPAQRIVKHTGGSGILLAFDAAGLVKFAQEAGCTIELVPRAGDFLAKGEDLFRLRGASTALVPDAGLRRCVAFGPEQTLERDPVFGLRILVEIAIKALSPAINDPTTGVLAVDHIHQLLHLLGQRQLDVFAGQDSSGEGRLLFRTPCWEDFLTLAVTEIRLYGATNPQITRRLQAMFEDLIEAVPPERAGALRKEMALLQRAIDRNFADPDDRILAGVGDLQGFGSRRHDRNPGASITRAMTDYNPTAP